LSICQFGCQPPETEDFFCDYLGQMCVWDMQRQGGDYWSACNLTCVSTYSCNPYSEQCYLDPDGIYEDSMSCSAACP
jgi:hypothetical protein